MKTEIININKKLEPHLNYNKKVENALDRAKIPKKPKKIIKKVKPKSKIISTKSSSTSTKTTKNKGGNVTQTIIVNTGKSSKRKSSAPQTSTIPKSIPQITINPVINIPKSQTDSLSLTDFLASLKGLNEAPKKEFVKPRIELTEPKLPVKEYNKVYFAPPESDTYFTEAEVTIPTSFRSPVYPESSEEDITEIPAENIRVYKKPGRKPKSEEQKQMEAEQKQKEREAKILERNRIREEREMKKEQERLEKQFAKEQERLAKKK